MKRAFLLLMAAAISAASLFAEAKPLTIVWYPNNSGEDWKAARQSFDDLITKATNRPVVDKLTTDYVIAIEAIASGNADICYPGAVGYIQASMKNPKVVPIVTVSSSKGTLDDSVYYSRIAVRTEDASKYATGSGYALDNVKGKVMSFVSSSSTSGFLVPGTVLKSYFAKKMKWGDKDKVEDLFLEGGADKFFSQVIFGQSHQGSIFNVLAKKADVCAVDDIDVDSYFTLTAGKASTPGAVYVVKSGADAPFDTLAGASFTVISSSAVRQAPIIANMNKLSQKEFDAIRALLVSDATTNNPKIFTPDGYKDENGNPYKGMWKKTASEHFLPVDAKWYDDIRAMMR